jgi:hypothetical protein
MMEVNTETQHREAHKPNTAVSDSWPAKDNQREPLSFGRPVFPEDTVARDLSSGLAPTREVPRRLCDTSESTVR